MSTPIDPTQLNPILTRIMAVEDITLGGPQHPFVLRARGQLVVDSEAAYEELASAAEPMGLLPVFRAENGKHIILLVRGPAAASTNGWTHLILFFLTLVSVIFTGALNAVPTSAIPCETPATFSAALAYQGKLIVFAVQSALANLPAGLPFALTLLAILGAHELGHYIAGRINKTPVTLPFFIPLPLLSPFGTMGAVISMRRPPRNRNRLAEIAVAGPFAGFLVGVPLLLLGLKLSQIGPLPITLGACDQYVQEGNSILYILAKLAVFGRMLPAPAQYDISPVFFWVQSFFTGFPFPTPGVDVSIGDIASAAWAGLMITGLNLIPAGQLDGGHMLYVLLGDKANRYLPVIVIALVTLGLFWSGWLLLALLILIFGRMRAEPLDTITPLRRGHRALAILGLVLFLLLFTPIPMQIFGG